MWDEKPVLISGKTDVSDYAADCVRKLREEKLAEIEAAKNFRGGDPDEDTVLKFVQCDLWLYFREAAQKAKNDETPGERIKPVDTGPRPR